MKIKQRRDIRSYTTKYIICGVVTFINIIFAVLVGLKHYHHYSGEMLLPMWGCFCALSFVSLVYFLAYDWFIIIINNYSERDCIDYNVGMTEEYLGLACLTCIGIPSFIFMVGGSSWILMMIISKIFGLN